MKIVKMKKKSRQFSDFKYKEWDNVHPGHFGHNQDLNLWKKEKILYKAVEGRNIIGIASGELLIINMTDSINRFVSK